MLSAILLGGAVAGTGGGARADGKFYVSEAVPPTVPYQRALLVFDGTRETLLVQSRYEPAPGQPVRALGWVIPVPAVPELASLDGHAAQDLFRELARSSPGQTTRISHVVFASGFWLLLASPLLLAAAMRVVPSLRRRLPISPRSHAAYRWFLIGYSAVLFSLVVVSSTSFVQVRSGPSGVDVIRADVVGVHHVQVVRSEEQTALVTWLNEGGFNFGPRDTAAFADYIRRRWCFVVAKVDPKALLAVGGGEGVSGGRMVAPLLVRFPAATPIYPLLLTGTTSARTQVLLYVLAPHKMVAGPRLALRAATAEVGWQSIESCLECAEPRGFVAPGGLKGLVLTKLKATLRSSQMSEDLSLAQAPDDAPVREHAIRW